VPVEEELQRRLTVPPGQAARRTGVEHEFRVTSGGQPIDFRSIIADLDLQGRAIVADDPFARRCRGGFVVTADGPEAEIASPPVAMVPGFSRTLLTEADRARASLVDACGAARSVQGWSTHLNVEVAPARARATAQLVATRFAPALMLLMDGPTSPGLLVRPRPARLEIGGEFVTGDGLRAAAVMAAGAVLTCERAASDRRARRALPPAPDARIQPARARYGHYVDRSAYGGDLYEHGRSASFRIGALRRTQLAQHHLEACWRAAEVELTGVVAPDELALAAAVVHGDLPLPLEGGLTYDFDRVEALTVDGDDPMDVMRRPGWHMRPTVTSWDFTAYEIDASSTARSIVVTVPACQVAEFRRLARAGDLDDVLGEALAAAPTGRVLDSVDQTGSVGIFDRVGSTEGLTPDEIDPTTGRPFGLGGGRGGGAGRRAKREQASDGGLATGVTRASRGRRGLVAIAALVVIVLVGGGIAVATRGGSKHAATPTTLPDTPPFAPTDADRRDAHFDGTFAAVLTITESDNLTAPIGTTEDQVWSVTQACSTVPCTLDLNGSTDGSSAAPTQFSFTFDGSNYTLDSEFVTGCFAPDGTIIDPQGSIAETHIKVQASQVARRGGQLVVTELRGTQFVTGRTNPASSACVDAEIKPFTYTIVATLNP
jgi:hypothetical protein